MLPKADEACFFPAGAARLRQQTAIWSGSSEPTPASTTPASCSTTSPAQHQAADMDTLCAIQAGAGSQ